MYVNIVQFDVKPEYFESAIAAFAEDGRSARRDEPGTVRFNVIRDAANPNRLYLYEVYADRDAFEAHRQGPHAKHAIETVRGWLAGPPVGIGSGFTAFPP